MQTLKQQRARQNLSTHSCLRAHPPQVKDMKGSKFAKMLGEEVVEATKSGVDVCKYVRMLVCLARLGKF